LVGTKYTIHALRKCGSGGALHSPGGTSTTIPSSENAGTLVANLDTFSRALGSTSETPNVRLGPSSLFNTGSDKAAIKAQGITEGALVTIDDTTDCGERDGIDGAVGSAGNSDAENVGTRADGVRELNRDGATAVGLVGGKGNGNSGNGDGRDAVGTLANVYGFDGGDVAASGPAPRNDLVGSGIVGSSTAGKTERSKLALELGCGANRNGRICKMNGRDNQGKDGGGEHNNLLLRFARKSLTKN